MHQQRQQKKKSRISNKTTGTIKIIILPIPNYENKSEKPRNEESVKVVRNRVAMTVAWQQKKIKKFTQQMLHSNSIHENKIKNYLSLHVKVPAYLILTIKVKQHDAEEGTFFLINLKV